MQTMSQLTLWGRSSALNVQKILWLLAELGLSYQHHQVGGKFGGLDTPDFLALNPNGRVPVLVDDDLVIWESHAILRYLAARYGQGTWWSENLAQRSVVDRWLDWSATSLQPSFVQLFWHYYRTDEAKRDAPLIAQYQAHAAYYYRLLDQQLSVHPFVTGASLSLADIAIGATIHRYFQQGLEVERPAHLWRWYQELLNRPAFVQTIAVDFSELKGRAGF
jgi:glutathione S-transferase